MDIFVECNAVCQEKKEHLMLIIENKVYSCEHSSQTAMYRDYFDKFDCKKIYIFLTPPYHKHGAECKEYIHLTYQDLLDKVFEPLLNKNVLFSRAVGEKKNKRYQGFKIDFCTLGMGICAYGIFGAA